MVLDRSPELLGVLVSLIVNRAPGTKQQRYMGNGVMTLEIRKGEARSAPRADATNN